MTRTRHRDTNGLFHIVPSPPLEEVGFPDFFGKILLWIFEYL